MPLPRLDRVCRQVYEEASLLMYSKPTFRFANAIVLGCWLGTVKAAHRSAIQRLRVGSWFTALPGSWFAALDDERDDLEDASGEPAWEGTYLHWVERRDVADYREPRLQRDGVS